METGLLNQTIGTDKSFNRGTSGNLASLDDMSEDCLAPAYQVLRKAYLEDGGVDVDDHNGSESNVEEGGLPTVCINLQTPCATQKIKSRSNRCHVL